MVSIDGKIVNLLLAAPADAEYWLVGFEVSHIINIIPLVPQSQAQSFLPGGLKILGKFFASSLSRDFLELSKSLSILPCIFLERTEIKLQSYIIDPPLLSQKEVSIKPAPPLLTLYSKSTIPLFSLDSPCWFLEKPVLYSINGQILSASEANSWASLGIKGKSLVSLDLFYELTTDTEDFAPTLSVLPHTRSYSVQIGWCSSVLDSTPLPEALNLHLCKLKELVDYIIQGLRGAPERNASCFSFLNDFTKHPINVVYFYEFWNEDSAELENERRKVHEIFSMPGDWPLVRSTCSIKESDGFRDVHLALLEPRPADVGVKSTVRGHYAYFHYAQDGFDDKGWGCAYRSLQTIISWLREQNYFQKEIPSHYQIQKLLVEAGDKPKEFIGSKEWIGAFEVMLILDTYCGITCKILSLASGAEFATKGRELANHFNTEGTPIMIGGGVLAYTLLGVDYNGDTGECKYLILDPHYVGADNLNTILQKGWCAWKGNDIFRNECFYNLCLPQRPRYI